MRLAHKIDEDGNEIINIDGLMYLMLFADLSCILALLFFVLLKWR